MNQNQIKLSGAAALALWDAGRRDAALLLLVDGVSPILHRPLGDWPPYTLATDEPLTTPQADAVCGVSPLVEVARWDGGPPLCFAQGAWQELDAVSGEWVFASYSPGNSVCSEWRLVAGDVREEEHPAAQTDPVPGLTLRCERGRVGGQSPDGTAWSARLVNDPDGVVNIELSVGSGLVARIAVYTNTTSICCAYDPPPLTLPHRTDSLSAAVRHAEGGGVVERMREAGQALLNHYDRETCRHEELMRLGAIWTKCLECDEEWADDRGGFVPYVEPDWVTQARDLFSDSAAPEPEPEPVKPLRGRDLRLWAIDHAPRVVLVTAGNGRTYRQRWNDTEARFEYQSDKGLWLDAYTDDEEEGVPESGTWERT